MIIVIQQRQTIIDTVHICLMKDIKNLKTRKDFQVLKNMSKGQQYTVAMIILKGNKELF
jgi:hypothetical protein